jgi:serine/threonine protein phosphatase PrpC
MTGFPGFTDTLRAGIRLRDEVLDINATISEKSFARGLQTATTLSALLMICREYYIVHAGDSRIYAIGSAGLVQLTIDTVNESGKLTSYIGKHDGLELHYAEGVTQSGVFLLCSDGLYKRMDDNSLYKGIDASNRKSLRKSLDMLTSSAIERGERDNISAAIVKLT